MGDQDQIRRQFAALRAEYAARLPGVIADLKKTIGSWFHTGFDPALLEKAYHQVHKLSGTGATFGLNAVTAYSKKIENILSLIKQGKMKPDRAAEEQLLALLGLLEQESGTMPRA